MSSPEKRDERSMSDILASIRKIMAQEPAGAEPLGPPPTLNGVSGAKFDLSREPELKLPPEKKPSEGFTPSPSLAAEAVSLDELLAETPRMAPPTAPAPAQALAAKPPVQTGPAPALGPAVKPVDAPEWLFPKPQTPEAKEKPAAPVLPLPTQSKGPDASSPAGPSAKIGPLEQPTPVKEAASAATPIGPPAPKGSDLGSFVPSKRNEGATAPVIAVGPPPSANADITVLGPPLAGPLLGEPTRTPSASEALPEVPGADALRRLIAGVIPPSSHPSVTPGGAPPSISKAGAQPTVAPAAKTPEPATARVEDAIKSEAAPKPSVEIKTENNAAPIAPASAAKKPEVAAPTPAPMTTAATKPIAAAPMTAPAPKPATPAPAAKTEPHVGIPAPKPAAASATASLTGKTMDETVVELLRPLLREWLNTNMPRLIEPALKAELEALRDAMAKEKKD